ncbi:MAG: magnesium transporter [Myxococcota bacterium]|nr:magnesium transporter [Myxococcota bacterium]
MRLATLLGPDLKDALQTDPAALHEALEEFHPEDIAEIVEDIQLDDAVSLFRALPDDWGADVLERLPPEVQTGIIGSLSVEEAAGVLSEMSPDDLVDVVQELQEERQELVTELLGHFEQHEPEVAEEVRELSAYAEDVAGGLMTPDYVALPPETKCWEAIEEVRRLSRAEEVETIYYIYVIYGQVLVGVVSLRDLILGDPGETLADVMAENVVTVRDSDDQEEVATAIAKYDFNAIPVVDEHGNMLGVVTVDDVVDVVIEEATEDAHMMGAVDPIDDGYFETNLFGLFRSRVTWLSLLFVGGFLTATVMESFQEQLQTMLTLAIFVPLIISSGGNAGSQSASLIIRALAVGDVEPSDWWRVFGRELIVSVALGLVLGLLGFARAYFAADGGEDPVTLGLAVSLSTVGVVLVGSMVGSLLPLGIQRVGLDPAVSSTPFIASLVDVVGLLIYLSAGGAILSMA